MPRSATTTALATTLALALTACTTPPHPQERPLVLTTFTVLADMTRTIAGDRLDVTSLTRPGAPVHDYEPTPHDLARSNQADLILKNGLGLETWLTRFTDQIHAPTHTLTDNIDTIPITSGTHQDHPNPHAWISPTNGQTYIDNIQQALTELDPEGAQHYQHAAQHYKTQIAQTDTDLEQTLNQLPEHSRALVTCEGAFSYLARDTGLTEAYLWPTNAQHQGTPQRIAAVTEFVRHHDVPTVFCESTVNNNAQQALAHDTGTHLGPPLYVDSLSPHHGPAPTYLDLLRHNTRTIAQGLTPTHQDGPE